MKMLHLGSDRIDRDAPEALPQEKANELDTSSLAFEVGSE
jgi:hypothetical protein